MDIFEVLELIHANEYDSFEEFKKAVRAGKAKRPYYYDGDLYCNVCGEPWDKWEIFAAINGEKAALTREEAIRLLKGQGCPCCEANLRKRKHK
jgi:NDP-sugar pyrophosphorylase family protein